MVIVNFWIKNLSTRLGFIQLLQIFWIEKLVIFLNEKLIFRNFIFNNLKKTSLDPRLLMSIFLHHKVTGKLIITEPYTLKSMTWTSH